MSKENVEKLKNIFRKYELEFNEENFVFNSMIGIVKIIQDNKWK